MPKQRPNSDFENHFSDLDALVLAEIESLTQRPQPLRTRRVKVSNPKRQAETKLDNHGEPAPASRVMPIPRKEYESKMLSGEEIEGLFDEPVEYGDFSDMEEDERATATKFFNPEEEAFITRAVGFLSQRNNADMILNHIWEQLTEANPEGYFRPEDSRSASSGTNVEQASSRENSEGDTGA